MRAHRVRPAAVAACLLVLAACDPPLSPREVLDYAAARQRWRDAGFSSYAFQARVSCFCPPEMTVWNVITVVDGAVVSATPLDPAVLPPGVPGVGPAGWFTVDQLFDRIGASGHDGGDVGARYDPTLGYPTEVLVTCRPGYADCGSGTYLRELTPIPTLGRVGGGPLPPGPAPRAGSR